MQFFGNLRTIGQVKVDDPDQVKHHEVQEGAKDQQPNLLFLFLEGSKECNKKTHR